MVIGNCDVSIGLSTEYLAAIALIAKIEALKARVEGMKVGNAAVDINNPIPFYGCHYFIDAQDEFMELARKAEQINADLKLKQKELGEQEQAEEIGNTEAHVGDGINRETVVPLKGPLALTKDGVILEPMEKGECKTCRWESLSNGELCGDNCKWEPKEDEIGDCDKCNFFDIEMNACADFRDGCNFIPRNKQEECGPIGHEIGERCNRDGCIGVLSSDMDDVSCSCHNHPPCNKCVNERAFCPVCEWEEDGEE